VNSDCPGREVDVQAQWQAGSDGKEVICMHDKIKWLLMVIS